MGNIFVERKKDGTYVAIQNKRTIAMATRKQKRAQEPTQRNLMIPF